MIKLNNLSNQIGLIQLYKIKPNILFVFVYIRIFLDSRAMLSNFVATSYIWN